jgi:putative ABC transport system permease protein
VLLLLAAEGAFVTLLGVALGIVGLAVAIAVARPWLQGYGITLSASAPSAGQWWVLLAIVAAGFAASLVPGWRAYRMSLADGLSPRA